MCHILTLIAPDNERQAERLTVLYINDFRNFKRVIMTLQLPQLSGALSIELQRNSNSLELQVPELLDTL